MQVHYIYNEKGEKESVIIPYKDWQRIRQTISESNIIETKKKYDPTRLKGIYKNLDFDPELEAKALRDEWERLDI